MQINKFRNFVPNLSPHSLRLIRKMFVEYQNSQEELIKELESQVTLFDKISIHEHPSHFMKFNKETISYNACCSLLADLLLGGWKINLGIEGFQISKPEYNRTFEGASLDEVKDQMRKIQLVNRDKQVRTIEVQNFFKRMEQYQKKKDLKKQTKKFEQEQIEKAQIRNVCIHTLCTQPEFSSRRHNSRYQ